MKKVRISTRQIYYNYAQVDVFVPNTIQDEDLQEYLDANEDLYTDSIDKELSNNYIEFGFGLDQHGMSEKSQETEWRYDVLDKNNEPTYGGHL
jgi:hypothetical protein